MCASERKVLTSPTIVDSGRAHASSYPRPHAWSRGLQLLLMVLTCSVTCSEGSGGWWGQWWIPSCLCLDLGNISGSLPLEILKGERLLLLHQKAKKIKTFSVNFCEIDRHHLSGWQNCFTCKKHMIWVWTWSVHTTLQCGLHMCVLPKNRTIQHV